MLLSALVLVLIATLTATLYGAMLLAIGRDASPATERLPWLSWTRWDLWHYVSLGAHETVRVRTLRSNRVGRFTSPDCRDRP